MYFLFTLSTKNQFYLDILFGRKRICHHYECAECTKNYHCYGNQYCSGYSCVARTTPRPYTYYDSTTSKPSYYYDYTTSRPSYYDYPTSRPQSNVGNPKSNSNPSSFSFPTLPNIPISFPKLPTIRFV